MQEILPEAGFKILLFFSTARLVFILLRKEAMAAMFNHTGIFISFAGLVYIAFKAGRPPLSGAFEACFYITFILSLLELIFPKKTHIETSIAGSMVILLVLVLQSGNQMALNNDYYMYDSIWVVLFFNMRLLSGAFFLYFMVLNITDFFIHSSKDEKLSRYSKVFLLAGIFIYLVSEWAGSVWCLNWFGDSWRWSHGFFKAAILFLLAMLLCHMPKAMEKNRLVKLILGSLPGCFSLAMISFH